jgi:hypothetical protein
MAPYVVVPMPKEDINGSDYIKIVLPIDFLNLPRYLKWVWRSDVKEAFALDADMTIVAMRDMLAKETTLTLTHALDKLAV